MSKHSARGTEWEKTRARILERDDHTCYACYGEADEVDHLVPISKFREMYPDEDPNQETNLAAICKSCNASKGDRLPTWRPYINPKYSAVRWR